MTEIPHYVQTGSAPAITGSGFGLFPCPCGKSLLIAGYEPRQFLGIALRCAACGEISETPGLSLGAPPPPAVTLVERGAEQPPAAVAAGTVLIGREEMERLAALYLPRHALHAQRLEFSDLEGRRVSVVAPAPADLEAFAGSWP